MIVRYCFVRLTAAHATDAGRAAALAELARLATLADLTVVAGVGADDSAASWDLAIELRASTRDALAAAMAAPLWREIFDGLAARAAIVKAWNFAVAPL